MKTIFKTPPTKISHLEPWRNLNYTDYVSLKHELTIKGNYLLAVNTKLISGELTPLEVAYNNFSTADAAMLEVKRRTGILAVRNEPVLITGETGTGKELIARMLHGNREGKFIAVNVTATVETLFESELFGHEKGSFTGAITTRVGRVAEAAGGTLFMDEIGDMPLTTQAKILRLLQERTYCSVGSNVEHPVNCRFVFATHCNLEELCKVGKFRLDLFHRINVFNLHLTPLRERRRDVELLVGKDLAERLKDNYLSGNVREVQAIALRYDVFGE